MSRRFRRIARVAAAGAAGALSAGAATYTIVSDRGVPWTEAVTLPEFPPDGQILARLRIINDGDPWDRAGRVWIQTPAGKVDLIPFVTGFGGTYWNDDVDVSALRPLLKGRVEFGGAVDQNTGWKMTLTLESVAGGNPGRRAIWAAKGLTSGTVWDDGDGDAGPKDYGVTIPAWPAAMFSRVYLTFFASGHGSESGGCEFNTGTFRIWADGTTVLTVDPWRDASDDLRGRNPTSGRWDGNSDGDTTDAYPTDYWSSDFARSGWLPGDYVHPHVVDITSAVGAIPGAHTISYDYLDNIGTAGGYWIISSHISATASTNVTLAASATNGEFETNSGAAFDAAVDGWLEHEGATNGCGIWGTGAAAAIPGALGDQLSLVALDAGTNTATAMQFLGCVRAADVGKTLVLTAGAVAWDWNASVKPFAGKVTLSFRTGASPDPMFFYGDPLGTAGSITTGVSSAGDGVQNGVGDGGGLKPLRATYSPSAADVGKQVFAVINLGHATLAPSGEERFVVDNVKLSIQPALEIPTDVGRGADAAISEDDGTPSNRVSTGSGTADTMSVRFTSARNEVALLRFDLSQIAAGPIGSAALSLVGWSDANDDRTFRLMGLNNGRPNQTWAESSITASNAPGFLWDGDAATAGRDTANGTDLGAWSPGTTLKGVTRTFSSDALRDWLNTDTDDLVTILVFQDAYTSASAIQRFATKETTLLSGDTNPVPAGTYAPYLTVGAFVDHAPAIGHVTNRTINEDAATGPIPFIVGDAETAPAMLTVTGASSNTNLVPTANLVLGGAGANRTVTVTPATNQSGSATITLRVSEGALAATDTFALAVNAVNDAPVLAAITNRTLGAGQTLAVTNAATDVDLPAQALTFSLLACPTGAAIGAASGLLTWRPAVAQANSTNLFRVRVADNGSPILSATQQFTAVVRPMAGASVTETLVTNNQFRLMLAGDAGPDYTVQASTNAADWSTLFTTNSPPTPFPWTDPASGTLRWRLYRALLGP